MFNDIKQNTQWSIMRKLWLWSIKRLIARGEFKGYNGESVISCIKLREKPKERK